MALRIVYHTKKKIDIPIIMRSIAFFFFFFFDCTKPIQHMKTYKKLTNGEMLQRKSKQSVNELWTVIDFLEKY